MKILYIATSFPEPVKGATIYTDLAEALQEAGHKLTVVVSEQAKNKNETEFKKERGFDVLRIITGNYYDVGIIEKGMTMLKFPYLMRKGIKRFLTNSTFDVILFESQPVTNASLVSWAKKRFKCPAYLMLKDIFPQNAVDLNMMKSGSIIHRFFKTQESKMYQTADYIGCTSKATIKYVLDHNTNLDPNKFEIFPNTKKLVDAVEKNENLMRKQFGIPKDACVFLFGGNMGKPQYINLLCKAIESCKDQSNIFFLFIGRGTDKYMLEKTIEEHNIKNALLIDNLPREEYENISKECDVGLIVLDPRFTIPNFPSRILSYMENAKPVLAATDRVTDMNELIEEAECGEWVWSGDTEAFIAKVMEMADDNKLSIKGDNGRRYIESNFSVERSVEILEKHFK